VKPIKVWCVVGPTNFVLTYTTSRTRRGAIADWIAQSKIVDWKYCLKQGYTVQQFELVPVKKARNK
jgi:hypothetical protein